MVGAGVSAVSGVVLVAIITNGFPKELAGTLFAATSAFLIISAISSLGTDTGLVRVLPQQLSQQRSADVIPTLRISLTPVLALSGAIGLAMFASASQFAEAVVGDEQAPTMTTMLRILACFLPIAAANDVLLAATRGFGTMRPTVMVESLGRLGAQPILTLGVYLAGAGGLALTLAWSVPYALALLVSAIWLRRLLRRRVVAGPPSRDIRAIAREFWSFTAPRAIAKITQTALKRADILMVAALASPVDAALYTAATRFVVLGQLGVQALQQALAPQLSSLFAIGDKRGAQQIFQAATAWMMILAWPIYLCCATYAPELLSVFGSGYDTGSAVVVILSLTMLLATAGGPVDSVLLMAGRSWLSLVNNTIGLAVDLGLNVILIPRYGITGAAVSWAVAIVVRNALPLVQVRSSIGMWPGSRGAIWVGLSALVCFGALPGLVALASGPLLVQAAVTVLGAVIYCFVLWRIRDQVALVAFRGVLRSRAAYKASREPVLR
jgi:O-antigen/teichoic acid export membrane protein